MKKLYGSHRSKRLSTQSDKETPRPIDTTHIMEFQFCLRCGRKLKSVEAKQLGMGKICYAKVKNNQQMKLF